jgi:hypothetical protein
MDDRVIVIFMGTVLGITAGYALGGWIEYRKGFETGIKTALGLANSITVTPKNE